ncbi:Cas10/Cmr2 second palm domain-containing protein [Magnetococcales bacterium HHB-1]
MANEKFSYHFAATKIQEYVLRGGKLKDLVGASELVASLTGEGVERENNNKKTEKEKKRAEIEKKDNKKSLLYQTLSELFPEDAGIPPQKRKIRFSRQGGGVFTAYSDDKTALQDFRNLWSLAVPQFIPGLNFVHGWGYDSDGDDLNAIQDAIENADDSIPFNHEFPLAGPLVEYAPRTGGAAVTRSIEDQEFIDAATERKRRPEFRTGSRLGNRFFPGFEKENYVWPIKLSAEDKNEKSEHLFPFSPDEKQTLAVIHADGNNLGRMIRGLLSLAEREKFYRKVLPPILKAFSNKITEITFNAAQTATEEVLIPHAIERDGKKVIPARPIVLGGDDLTIIVRTDLALDFAISFLKNFEDQSQTLLGRFLHDTKKLYRIDLNMPRTMTATAGITYFHAKQPFALCYRLAEDLCAYAKAEGRRAMNNNKASLAPSLVAFHRITTSAIDRYGDILNHELKVDGAYLTAQPYVVLDGSVKSNLIPLDKLRDMAEIFSRGVLLISHLRELLTLLSISRAEAKRRYSRWRENLTKEQDYLWKETLIKTLGEDPKELPFVERNGKKVTPIADLLAILAVEKTDSGER